MLANKTFVKKTKRGAVVKVVREHYLRDDVWCGVSGCGQCKQGDPLLDTHPDTVSDLCVQPHIILPDTNVVLHQVDFLEDPAITNVILLSVVLQEVCIHVLVHVHVRNLPLHVCSNTCMPGCCPH